MRPCPPWLWSTLSSKAPRPACPGQGLPPPLWVSLGGLPTASVGGRRRQIGHLVQQRLLVPRVLRLSQPPDVGDVLLLDVPHVGDQLQGAEQPPLQSLPEIIWPCRHFQGLEGVVKHPRLVNPLVRLLRRRHPYPPGTDLAAWP